MQPPDHRKGPHSETTVVSESVVLTKENTPTRLWIEDHDDRDDAEQPLEQEPVSLSAPAEEAGPNPWFKYNPVRILLKLLRQPENLLIARYAQSSVRRRLRDRFEWYCELEGEQELANKLQNAYGGTNSPLRNLAHFGRNNILASLLAIGISFNLFVDYLSQPAASRHSAHKRVSDADDTQSRAAAPLAAMREAAERPHVLDHCAVTESLRVSYDNARDPGLKDQLLAEVDGFIRVYSGSAIEQWYGAQDAKHDIVIAQLRSTLPKIRAYEAQVAREIADATRIQTELHARLNQITAATSPDLEDINKSIKLRAELAKVEAKLRDGPSTATLAKLDGYLERLEGIIAGEIPVRAPSVSYWAIQASEQSEQSLTEAVKNIIDQDIYASIDQASRGAPEAQSYRLEILAATLRHFGDLVGQLKNTSNFYEAQVGVRQDESNHRLTELLRHKSRQAQYLDYDNCLTALSTADNKAAYSMTD